MYVKNIVICDCEKQYAKNLLQIFSGKKVAGIRLYLFDTVEEAAEFSEKETIHIFRNWNLRSLRRPAFC